jgi:hypothetical protein
VTEPKMPEWAVRLEGKVDLLKADLTAGLREMTQALDFNSRQAAQATEGVRSETARAHARLDSMERRQEEQASKIEANRRDNMRSIFIPIFCVVLGVVLTVLFTHYLGLHPSPAPRTTGFLW